MPSRFTLYIIACFAALLALVLLSSPNTLAPLTSPNYTPNNQVTKPTSLVWFEDITAEWSIHPAHQQSAHKLSALTETLGSGVCVQDFNNDGWMDIFFIGGSGFTRHYGLKSWWHKERGNLLLINQGGHSFTNETQAYGLNESMHGMGCVANDFNNDGFYDLFITTVGTNYLYKNNGNSTFARVKTGSEMLDEHWSTAASVGDFNKDGLLDIYLGNYIDYQKEAKTFERTSGFTTSNVPYDPTLYNSLGNRLYLNKGDFTFEDVAQTMGVNNAQGRSLGSRWLDKNTHLLRRWFCL